MNSMQLKDKLKNISKEKNVDFNTLLRLYMYDRFIERLSVSKYKDNLEKVGAVTYGDENDDFFTDIILDDNNYLVVGYSSYEDGSYLSKFITYSDALKALGVE